MISPSNTAIGLTTDGPGTSRASPDKYYPTGRAHLLPHHAQRQGPGRRAGDGDARPRLQADRRRVTDREIYGAGVGTLVRQDARPARPAGRAHRRASRRGTRSFGRIRGGTASSTPASRPTAPCACSAASARGRSAQLFAGDGVAESGFTRPPARLDRPARDAHRVHAGPGRLPRRRDHRQRRPVQDLRLRGDEADPRRPQRRRRRPGRPARLPAGRPEPRERARHLLLRRQRRHDPAHLRPLRHPAQAARVGREPSRPREQGDAVERERAGDLALGEHVVPLARRAAAARPARRAAAPRRAPRRRARTRPRPGRRAAARRRR